MRITPQTLRAFQMKRHHLVPGTRGETRQDLVGILRDTGGLPWMTPIHARMTTWRKGWMSKLEYQERQVMEGRFFGGCLQYIPTEEVATYFQAMVTRPELTLSDQQVLEFVRDNGPVARLEMQRWIPLETRQLAEALHRLDLGLWIVRCGWREGAAGWGQPLWCDLESWAEDRVELTGITAEEAREALVLKFLYTNGPLGLTQLAALFRGSLKPYQMEKILNSLTKRGAIQSGHFLEGWKEPQWVVAEMLRLLEEETGELPRDFACVLPLGDPFAILWRSALAARFSLQARTMGPAWLAALFLGTEPVGVVEYQWRQKTSRITCLQCPPELLADESLSTLLSALEREARQMGQERVEIHAIANWPIETLEGTSLLEGFLSAGYLLENRCLVHIVPLSEGS